MTIKLKFGYLLSAALLLASPQAFADSAAVDELNELLRGERSAVETYSQALEKVGSDPGADRLRDAQRNHQEAVSEISREISRLGGDPSTTSGAWGAWAKTVTGSAKLLGDSAALKALKEGEEHGIKEYQEVLEEDGVPQEFKAKVRDKFLPQQREHIAALDSMIERAS